MGPIRVNPQVYEAVRGAQDDYTLGGMRGKDISSSEMKKIEDAITADGTVDGEEKKLMDALRSGTSFTVTNGTDSTPIDPKSISFPAPGSVTKLAVGQTTIDRSEKPTHVNLPSYIPTNTKGGGTDVINHDTYADKPKADAAFATAKSRMLDVNNWGAYAAAEAPKKTMGGHNPAIPSFSIHNDANGDGKASVGDVIKIAAPPGSDMFVKVKQVIDKPGEFAIQVQPCDSKGNTVTSEHMYTSAATNTFRLTQDGNTVTNGFHGRNEVVNNGSDVSTARGIENYGVDKGMAAGGRSFSWNVMGDAWRPDP